MERISPTILEAINKVGSMANGPLLALFCTAVFFPAVGQRAAITGFCLGLAANPSAWLWLPQLSWLWWNVLGFAVAMLVGLLLAAESPWRRFERETLALPRPQATQLLAMMALMLVVCLGLEYAD